MSFLRTFWRDRDGGPAAEFALVLPIALLFLFGIIDVGRYMWEVNRIEKATQTGARWAVSTDMIASDLAAYSFAASGGILQGEPVPSSSFPGVRCTSAGCVCKTSGACAFGLTANSTAFNALVNRMNDINGRITAANVMVDYDYSGLGYAGDPNGPDVAPIVSVTVRNFQFSPLLLSLFGGSVQFPDLSYSLTMEDGEGTFSN